MAGIITTGGAKKITAIDDSGAGVTYIGFAKLGSVTSAAVWQILKIEEGAVTYIKYADGDSGFNNIWDNRAALNYS